MSITLFCSCSLKVAARIRHNKVLFVLHHTMSTMFLVALLVQSFPEFCFPLQNFALDVPRQKKEKIEAWLSDRL